MHTAAAICINNHWKHTNKEQLNVATGSLTLPHFITEVSGSGLYPASWCFSYFFFSSFKWILDNTL
jgi:hypothetical protein